MVRYDDVRQQILVYADDVRASSDEEEAEVELRSGSRQAQLVGIALCTIAAVLMVLVRAGGHSQTVEGNGEEAVVLDGSAGIPPLPKAFTDPVLQADRQPAWQCSANGEDCRNTTCCSESGSQCYVKNEYWASCNATCAASFAPSGVEEGETWSCKALGPRAPPACSWEGENCQASKCCKRTGFKCFEQDYKWAGCSDECSNLLGTDPHKLPWSCKVLGGSQGAHFAEPVPAFAATVAGVSMYCFSVITPDGVVAPGVEPGYEKPLMQMMKAQNLGIFGCEASRVYEGTRVEKGDWSSVVNTDIFISVWQKVQTDGKYKEHDWTVKVDADAVFFPSRLKAHLSSIRPQMEEAIYLHNIKFRFHFMGALEVMSKKAVDIFLANAAVCSEHLGSNGGEDFFTMQCLDALGVGHMSDFSLLDDKYSHGQGWNLFDVTPCTDGAIVAYHPYKHVNSWQGCYKVAMGMQKPTDFVGCQYRWHGDACALGSTRQHLGTDIKPTNGIIFRK